MPKATVSKAMVSIVIPCYNEEEGLSPLAQQLLPAIQKLSRNYDVEPIFVDDGSTDRTNELLHHYFSGLSNVKILKHERNKNLGAALRTGFSQASGDLIAALDSDCTYSPELIGTMAEMMDENTDIVTVSPYHPQGKVNNVPAYRIFLSKSASRLYRIVLGYPLYTYTAMVRMYKKEVVQNVPFEADNFLGVTELLVNAVLKGYQVKELPVELQARKFGVSKMKTFPIKVMGNHLALLSTVVKHKLFRNSR